MVNVAVIGSGVMGHNHVRIYSELGCNILGVVDKDEAKGIEVANLYSTTWYPDYQNLIGKVDAVSIAVPTSLHSRVAIDFLNKGTHCLVEKPIASTTAEAGRMIKAAKEHNAILMIGHIERFNPAVRKLQEILASGALGKLITVSTRRVGPYSPRIRDVGIVIDSATHDIDIVRSLMNREPVNVYAKTGSYKHSKEDHAIIVCDFGDAFGVVEVNWFTPHKVRTLVATCTDGICYLDYINQELAVHNSHENHSIEILKQEPLKLEISHFLRCVETGMNPEVDGETGLNVLEIALRATSDEDKQQHV